MSTLLHQMRRILVQSWDLSSAKMLVKRHSSSQHSTDRNRPVLHFGTIFRVAFGVWDTLPAEQMPKFG